MKLKNIMTTTVVAASTFAPAVYAQQATPAVVPVSAPAPQPVAHIPRSAATDIGPLEAQRIWENPANLDGRAATNALHLERSGKKTPPSTTDQSLRIIDNR